MRITILLFVAFLSISTSVDAQIISNASDAEYSSSEIISDFTIPEGNDRLLLVATFKTQSDVEFGPNQISPQTGSKFCIMCDLDVVFGPTQISLTKAHEHSYVGEIIQLDVAFWYLTLGSDSEEITGDIAVLNGSSNLMAMSLQNVDQTTVFINPLSNSGIDELNNSILATNTGVNNLIVDAFITDNTSDLFSGVNPLTGVLSLLSYPSLNPMGQYLGQAMGNGNNIDLTWGTPLKYNQKLKNSSGFGFSHIAIELVAATSNSAAIPTLSQWGLIILALLLMTLGTLYLVQPISSREKV